MKNYLNYIPEVGDVVEVWIRDSPRHKYWMESSLVQILAVVKEEDAEDEPFYSISVKNSNSFSRSNNHSNGINGSTSFQTCGCYSEYESDTWNRAFVKIGELPVKINNFNPPKNKKG
jgi:hypothetical protein